MWSAMLEYESDTLSIALDAMETLLPDDLMSFWTNWHPDALSDVVDMACSSTIGRSPNMCERPLATLEIDQSNSIMVGVSLMVQPQVSLQAKRTLTWWAEAKGVKLSVMQRR